MKPKGSIHTSYLILMVLSFVTRVLKQGAYEPFVSLLPGQAATALGHRPWGGASQNMAMGSFWDDIGLTWPSCKVYTRVCVGLIGVMQGLCTSITASRWCRLEEFPQFWAVVVGLRTRSSCMVPHLSQSTLRARSMEDLDYFWFYTRSQKVGT